MESTARIPPKAKDLIKIIGVSIITNLCAIVLHGGGEGGFPPKHPFLI